MSKFSQLVQSFEDYLLRQKGVYGLGVLRLEHEGEEVRGYPYIRLNHELFENGLLHCLPLIQTSSPDQSEKPIRFLEVGSGLGTKCELARLYGCDCTGIDIQPEYLEISREAFDQCKFQNSNALTFDYGEFDLIYFHVPLADNDFQCQLECRVLSQMPVGSIMMVSRFSRVLKGLIESDAEFSRILNENFTIAFDDVSPLPYMQKNSEIETNLGQAFRFES